MPDPRDKVELSGAQENAEVSSSPQRGAPTPRTSNYLRLWFRCSNQYGRAYKSPDGRSYIGRCPTCAKTIRFGIASSGTDQRFFEVSC